MRNRDGRGASYGADYGYGLLKTYPGVTRHRRWRWASDESSESMRQSARLTTAWRREPGGESADLVSRKTVRKPLDSTLGNDLSSLCLRTTFEAKSGFQDTYTRTRTYLGAHLHLHTCTHAHTVGIHSQGTEQEISTAISPNCRLLKI